jgi:hypothetical protein
LAEQEAVLQTFGQEASPWVIALSLEPEVVVLVVLIMALAAVRTQAMVAQVAEIMVQVAKMVLPVAVVE